MAKPANLYLDDDQLAALGDFATHWAYLESELDFTISAMGMVAIGDPKMPFPFDDRIKHWKRLLPKMVGSPHGLKFYLGIIRLDNGQAGLGAAELNIVPCEIGLHGHRVPAHASPLRNVTHDQIGNGHAKCVFR
jgi:hypothetical protein